MNNENPSKSLYKTYYRLFRKGVPSETWTTWGHKRNDEIYYCALESYDYHDSHFSGWINRQRMTAFEQRSRSIENWKGAIPF